MNDTDFFDTHAHICHPKLWDDREEVIARAIDANVKEIVCVGYDLESSRRSVQLAEQYAELHAAVGVSPHDVSKATPSDWEELEALMAHPQVVACGETGLDYHYMLSPKEDQIASLKRHVELARKHSKPVILHMRESDDDLFRTIEEANIAECGGVLHCFTGTVEAAERALEMGLMISFSGIVTFAKGDEISDAVKMVPLDRMLIETDCPYLAPKPYRGKTCEPFMLPRLAEVIAALKETTAEEIAERTAENAKAFFRI